MSLLLLYTFYALFTFGILLLLLISLVTRFNTKKEQREKRSINVAGGRRMAMEIRRPVRSPRIAEAAAIEREDDTMIVRMMIVEKPAG